MSSGGTSSLIHSHADHNLHCVLSGRKDFIVIDPVFGDFLEYKEKVSGGSKGALQTVNRSFALGDIN